MCMFHLTIDLRVIYVHFQLTIDVYVSFDYRFTSDLLLLMCMFHLTTDLRVIYVHFQLTIDTPVICVCFI